MQKKYLSSVSEINLGKNRPTGDAFHKIATDVIQVAKDYSKTKDADMRNALVVHFSPIAKFYALRMIVKSPAQIELQDLVQEGMIAIDGYFSNKFDAASDNSETRQYAEIISYLKTRVDGQIKDFIRVEVGQSGYSKALNGQMECLHNGMVSLDTYAQDDSGDDGVDNLLDYCEVEKSVTLSSSFSGLSRNPENIVEEYEVLDRIFNAVNRLPPTQKVVVEGRIVGNDYTEINHDILCNPENLGARPLSQSEISQAQTAARQFIRKVLGADLTKEPV